MIPVGICDRERLGQARERAGLSIQQAKTALGIASHYLEGMEDGSIEDLFPEVVVDCALLYGVDPGWLWLGLDENTRDDECRR